jgi:hypothetical protein
MPLLLLPVTEGASVHSLRQAHFSKERTLETGPREEAGP